MSLELMLEAERRGILPPDKAGLLAEARQRGLVPSLTPPAPPPGMRQVAPGEIPTESGFVPLPYQAPSRSLTERALGMFAAPADVMLTLASAIPRATVAPAYGVLFGGEKGAKEMLAGIRQPQTPEGQAVLESLGATTSVLPPVIGVGGLPAMVPPNLPAAAATAKGAIMRPIEPMLQARRERLSAESYARGPQLDAAAEAQRLKLVLNPADIQPTVGPRILAAVAGGKGQQAIVDTNRKRVREIVLDDLNLPSTTQLNTPDAFNLSRSKVSKPYDDVKKLPTMTADDALIERLDSLRADPNVIGSKAYAPAIDAIVDQAIAQTKAGLNGEQLLKNVRVLRERARKTYNNKSATIEALDVADTNLAIANTLESMIESNIFNPKLLSQFRDARQKMAKSYAYEGATDLNTGVVDVKKLARITSKDNALTGDIAALGQIAGNFPDAFSPLVATPMSKIRSIGRTGAAGTTGGVLGYALGGDYASAALGSVLGGTLGKIAEAGAARQISSPGYQAGLKIPDYRLPVNQLAAQAAAPSQNLPVVFDPRNALVQPSEIVGYTRGGEPITVEQAFTRPNFVMVQPPTATFAGPGPSPAQLPAPSAQSTMAALRAEDVRRASISRTLGQEAEAQQAATEAAARRPAAREVILDIDPITGRLREVSQGVKGATPETFQNYGASLAAAADKVTQGRKFDLSAAEKVAWERTKVDLAEVTPGMKALSDKAIAEKMLDRAWVEDAMRKARDKATAFAQIEARAKDAKTRQQAAADRERMLDLLEALEEKFRAPRPVVSESQGPKTRAAIRNRLLGGESTNNLIP